MTIGARPPAIAGLLLLPSTFTGRDQALTALGRPEDTADAHRRMERAPAAADGSPVESIAMITWHQAVDAPDRNG
ncbi:hypothetical protein ACIG5E_20295 [Kitasatospora sp. NPDC053057]|uniref:hypothetical protein n=1 Tax=Kitasatospora sp. NPDC053057 TaxID=3364062 RepID=UPI0037C66EC5